MASVSTQRYHFAAVVVDEEVVCAGPAPPAEAELELVAGCERADLAAAKDSAFPDVAEFGLTLRGVGSRSTGTGTRRTCAG